ncbi:MAG: hypothetical protein QW625_01655 [Candidatus Nanoarchaeia archaeon]
MKKATEATSIIFTLFILIIILLLGYHIMKGLFASSPEEKAAKELKEVIETVCEQPTGNSLSINIYVPEGKILKITKDKEIIIDTYKTTIKCANIQFSEYNFVSTVGKENICINVTKEQNRISFSGCKWQ